MEVDVDRNQGNRHIPVLQKMVVSNNVDLGGHRWLPTCPPDSKHLFSSLAAFTVFQVLNFQGRFEALNDVFWKFRGQGLPWNSLASSKFVLLR